MTEQMICRVLAERERIMIQERELSSALEALKRERKPLDVKVAEFLGDEEETEVSKWIVKRIDRRGYEVPPCSYIMVKVNSAKLVAKRTAA